MTAIKVDCSNCLTTLTLRPEAETIEVRLPAAGRGSKRVEARTLVADATFDGALWLWDSPCCEGYADSLEVDS